MELGYFIGDDLNASNDNLAFTREFKRRGILDVADHEFARLTALFAEEMQTGCRRTDMARWGWKEPNTHLVIDRLLRHLPSLRYIHVIRNDFDMAHSANQNQARLWGDHLLGGDPPDAITPRYSLKYWCAVHRRLFQVIDSADAADRFLLLHFDDLCRSPVAVLQQLSAFLEVPVAMDRLRDLARIIQPPASRWRAFGLAVFDQEDIDYAVSLGFVTDDTDASPMFAGG